MSHSNLAYLADLAYKERGLAAGSPWPVDYGPELSRGFRALKVWTHLMEHGTSKLGASIERNCQHAQHLARLIDSATDLELLAPVVLQIVAFRYVPAHSQGDDGAHDGAQTDQLNDQIVQELQERGIAAPSTTKIHGALAIRVSITNHRTRFCDLDLLVREVQRLGVELGRAR